METVSKPVSLLEVAQELVLKMVILAIKLFFIVFSLYAGLFLFLWGLLGFGWVLNLSLTENHMKEFKSSEGKAEMEETKNHE